MTQLSHMIAFLNHLRTAEGEERQKLVEHNKHLLRTELAQHAAQQRIELYGQHVRRLEVALKLVRNEQQRRAGVDPEGEGEGT